MSRTNATFSLLNYKYIFFSGQPVISVAINIGCYRYPDKTVIPVSINKKKKLLKLCQGLVSFLLMTALAGRLIETLPNCRTLESLGQEIETLL